MGISQINTEALPAICDLDELCSLLRLNRETAKAEWRKYPHFFPTKGRSAKTVLFQPAVVLAYLILERGVGYGSVGVSDKAGSEVQGNSVPRRKGRRIKARLRDEEGSEALDTGGGEQNFGSSTPEGARHTLRLHSWSLP